MLPSYVSALSTGTLRDLRASGLTDDTIELAEIHEPLREAGAQASSYNIPYFDVSGQRTDFSRTKHLNPSSNRAKYSQAPGSPVHVYIPPHYSSTAPDWAENTEYRIVITEGEKKALAGAQNGILTLGLGGVDNWRSRTKMIPAEWVKHIEYGDKKRGVLLRWDIDRNQRFVEEAIAQELMEIDWRGRDVLLAYDTPDSYQHEAVMSAAFNFALWLFNKGAHVGVYYIPENGAPKVGLDDWLLEDPGAVEMLLDPGPTMFPPPPNPRNWLKNAFESRLTRNDQETMAMGVLAALDARGQRYKDGQGTSYFYETDTKTLHSFSWGAKTLRGTTFGPVLNNSIGLKTADTSVMSRLADLYQEEGYIRELTPERVMARTDNAFYVQVSNGEMARVTKDEIDIVDNGTDDVLFVAGAVQSLDADLLTDALELSPQCRWYDTIRSLKLLPIHPLSLEESQVFLTILMYMTPWLWRWRGMQLPLEMAVAEAGSGKTVLYNLRMEILTGSPKLRGMPSEIRDWNAQVAAAPGLWVCDNLGKMETGMFHQVSDELARLITEPEPSIDLREMYTEANEKSIPVRSAFAITTTKNGFTAPDITQRMVLFHLDSIPPEERNPGWRIERLGEGREVWIAEHLQYLQSFLQLADQKWDPTLQQKHRLIHFEQGVMLMGEALGFDADLMEGIRDKLAHTVDLAVAETNPLIEALLVMKVELANQSPITLTQAVEWAKYDPQERFNPRVLNMFSNSRQLGNALRDNRAQVYRSTGISLVNYHNQTLIKWDDPGAQNGTGPDVGRQETTVPPRGAREGRIGPPPRPTRPAR
jgi:Domain of unknown function (DUF3854)